MISNKDFLIEQSDRAIPGRPQLDMIPNPAFVSPELAASLTPEQMANSQFAYVVFHAMKDGRNWDVSQGHRRFYEEAGFDGVVEGFKGLRRLVGEEVFGGIMPAYSPREEQASLGEYLTAAHAGGVVINRWNHGHDVTYHLDGALLAVPEVRDFTIATTTGWQSLPPAKQLLLGKDYDRVTNDIQQMWLARDKNVAEDALRWVFRAMRDLSGRKISDKAIAKLVDQQAEAIHDLGSKEIFITALPSSLGAAALTGTI